MRGILDKMFSFEWCELSRPGCKKFTPKYIVEIRMPSGKTTDLLKACESCLEYVISKETERLIDFVDYMPESDNESKAIWGSCLKNVFGQAS